MNHKICKCGHRAEVHPSDDMAISLRHRDEKPQSIKADGKFSPLASRSELCQCRLGNQQAALPENSQAYYDALAIGTNLDGMYLIGKKSRRLKERPSQIIVGRIVGGERVDSGEMVENVATAMFGDSGSANHMLRIERGEHGLTVPQFVRLCGIIGRDDPLAPSASDIFLRCHSAILMAESDWFVDKVSGADKLYVDMAVAMYQAGTGSLDGERLLDKQETLSFLALNGVIPPEWSESEEVSLATDTSVARMNHMRDELMDTSHQVRRALDFQGGEND